MLQGQKADTVSFCLSLPSWIKHPWAERRMTNCGLLQRSRRLSQMGRDICINIEWKMRQSRRRFKLFSFDYWKSITTFILIQLQLLNTVLRNSQERNNCSCTEETSDRPILGGVKQVLSYCKRERERRGRERESVPLLQGCSWLFERDQQEGQVVPAAWVLHRREQRNRYSHVCVCFFLGFLDIDFCLKKFISEYNLLKGKFIAMLKYLFYPNLVCADNYA